MENFYLSKSNKKDKKYMITFINQDTNRLNTIHFGFYGMNDYTLTNDKKAKERYLKRHFNSREDWFDYYKPALNILRENLILIFMLIFNIFF
jgi:predicted NUDIX family phosphoesterase